MDSKAHVPYTAFSGSSLLLESTASLETLTPSFGLVTLAVCMCMCVSMLVRGGSERDWGGGGWPPAQAEKPNSPLKDSSSPHPIR